jgi:hypothetical protein
MGVPIVPVYGMGQFGWLQPAVGVSTDGGAGMKMFSVMERVVFVTVAVPPEVGVKVIVPNPETDVGVALTPDTVQS